MSVSEACGRPVDDVVEAAAVAIEMLHCASLIHDDLPSFDDALMRRGRPSVHSVFGPQLAILAGDGLIVAAFEVLARGCAAEPERLGPLTLALAEGVGIAKGLVAGQAWESERSVDLGTYHDAKTAALFDAAVRVGAIVAGAPEQRWGELGRVLGEAYQIADDIGDVTGSGAALGKPVGQDTRFGRPSAARTLGLRGAQAKLADICERLPQMVPECPGRPQLRAWFERLCARITPVQVVALPHRDAEPLLEATA